MIIRSETVDEVVTHFHGDDSDKSNDDFLKIRSNSDLAKQLSDYVCKYIMKFLSINTVWEVIMI